MQGLAKAGHATLDSSFYHVKIEGFMVADVILVVGQTRKIYSECMGKIVILMLDKSREFDILQFL